MTDLEFVVWGTDYLKSKGVQFTEDGFPIIKNEWLATDKPESMIPFSKKNHATSPSKTAIVFYSHDSLLYPRLFSIKSDINDLRKFHSVVSMDISVSFRMPFEVQIFNMLINFIYIAILGSNGIKIIPSLRCGEERTIPILMNFGHPSFWALGAVGCQKNPKDPYAESIFASKSIVLDVKSILSYGKLNKKNKAAIESLGIEIKEYDDFRRRSYGKEVRKNG